ncbi:MAG: head completion/stabilization protein [Betaproteobacteria bacterium HGW-Betaproteobacteria-4]|jgi:hypothetical protein|nr:MAG: head completion/stabilization protein [Betaproteobacteria bacterium HGW-Betaproteobacteria-4]
MIVNAPSTPESETPITIGAFWPDIEPFEIREAQRLDNTVTPPRLRSAIIESASTTIEALAAWKIAQIAIGYTTLSVVPSDEIDGSTIIEHRFKRAVGSLAKALLMERYRDFDASAKGDKRAEALTDPIDDCRRDHLNAIADITGRTRCTIELI